MHVCPLLKEQREMPVTLLLFTQKRTIWLTAISSNCLAALLAKIPAFNSHRRQNTHCRNLKLTFEGFVVMLLLCNKKPIVEQLFPKFRNLNLQANEQA